MCASLSAINRWVSLTMEDHYQLPTADDDEDEDTAIATTTISSNIFSLPEEVILKIIALLDPFDVWSLARTCKFFAQLTDNELLWRHQWAKLSAKTPFRFPPSHNLQVWGSKFFIFFTCCLLCDLHNFDIPAIYLWKCFYIYKLYAVFMSKLQFLCVPFVRSTVCNVYGLCPQYSLYAALLFVCRCWGSGIATAADGCAAHWSAAKGRDHFKSVATVANTPVFRQGVEQNVAKLLCWCSCQFLYICMWLFLPPWPEAAIGNHATP